uniref:Ankyrin and armadillo repeat-containing protein-like n=1 Tax=Phallusia mammillata TaxID=59560 RepID=A0A6F9D6K7_9ASCI|nr:ankyrin and armadillo repeat-containing protein-like [Phallusia mammillata]
MSDIEYDEDGWTAIHHCVAAEKELLMSIEKFVTTNEEYLEVETKDSFQRTPFLLAVERNKTKSVEKLIDLGSRVNAIDAENHGAVEICAMTENLELLHHFIELDLPDLGVWKRIVKFLSANTDEEAEKAAMILERLLKDGHGGEAECDNPHWEPFVQAGGIPAIVKVCKSSASDRVKAINIMALSHMIRNFNVPQQLAKAGGIKALISIISRGNRDACGPALSILQVTAATSSDLATQVHDAGLVQIAVKLLNNPERLPVNALSNAVLAIGCIAEVSEALQKAVGAVKGIFEVLHSLFEHHEYQTCVELLMSLTKTVGKIVANNNENQNTCIDAGGASPLIMVSRASKYRELQTNAINSIYLLSLNNPYAAKHILEEGAVMPLMQILKKSRALALQEAIALTLWSLAGLDINEKRSMASMMGANLLIEFLGAAGPHADNLNYIGAEGLGVLAQGAHNKQMAIAEANGIQPLVRQLRSSNSNVVTSVIRALRHLCVGIGYVTNTDNQSTVAQSRGLKFLVALMAHSRAEMIQVESAITLGAISLGNSENITSLRENPDFSFLHMIRLLYSSNDKVKILAGNALAMFSFNSVPQQKEIAECGGVRWNNFSPFLKSDDVIAAINAAFQVVVLSRIIPDEEPAFSSAEGIKTIVDRLSGSKDDDVRALASDCIARLAHTRAGVPSAMVSINVVEELCKLLQLPNDQVRGSASIALGYLSFDHVAERQMLHICRSEPCLVHVIKYYTKNYKLSPEFLEGWKHCLRVGLPGGIAKESKSDFLQALSQSISNAFMKPPKELSASLQTLTEDMGGSRSQSHPHSSRASQLLATIHDDMSQLHGRSTHSSRLTRNSRRTNSILGVKQHLNGKQSISPMSQDIGPSISQAS